MTDRQSVIDAGDVTGFELSGGPARDPRTTRRHSDRRR